MMEGNILACLSGGVVRCDRTGYPVSSEIAEPQSP